MKRISLLMMMICLAAFQLIAQDKKANTTNEAPNFFIITTDGLRFIRLKLRKFQWFGCDDIIKKFGSSRFIVYF